MATRLKDSSGDFVTLQENESCNLTGTLKDTSGATVTSPATFTLTLLDEASGAIVNSRKDQDVLNANGSTVSSGVYTIELDTSDTAIIGDLTEGTTQNRIARLKFTWDDGDSTRTGREEFFFPVEKAIEAIGVGSGSNEVQLTVTDANADAVPDVAVHVTSDKAGTVTVAGPVMTDANGQTPTLNLDAGTFYRWAVKTGWTFTNPTAITVT